MSDSNGSTGSFGDPHRHPATGSFHKSQTDPTTVRAAGLTGFSGKPPHLSATGFVHESQSDLPVEQALEVDRLCDAFEAAWLAGKPTSIEDALAGISDGLHPAAVRALVELDVFYHKEAGESPRVEDYSARFPDLDHYWLAEALIGCEQSTQVEDADPATRGRWEVGSVIADRYKLLALLGLGGMGEVWLAEQSVPIRRKVALKLIKTGLDSRTMLARFDAERQALAMMDHPNIATVLDAGATTDSHPYFVMELVKGVPITEFCDARQLTLRQRLELFIPVCRAIQHAHQKGIIHRDIKPTNVLVALYDEKPVPKVIDFGVAKATGTPLTENTVHTAFEAVVGTVPYMSPEQASLNQLDIDTRSDVYSLGVLLYELLTGTTPVEKARFKKTALLEMLRPVREEEPPRPSARLSTTEARASIAATRGTEPGRLSKLLRRELDWIVMKSLEKDRNRRYVTANGLARDVERYLKDEVVEARPPSVGYRARKFFRKHRGPVIAASFVLLALVGGVIGTTVGLYQAEAETTRANMEKVAAWNAERGGRERLYESLISEAKASRYSRRVGQRFGTLDAIRKAVALARELEKPPEEFAKLRNMAISALALPDLRPTAEWMTEPDEPDWRTNQKTLDPHLRWQAVTDQYSGAVSLRRIGTSQADSGEIARLPGFGGEAELEPSADGRFLAVRHWRQGGRVQVWQVDTPEPTLTMEFPSGCRGVAFGLDESVVTTHQDGRLRISDRRSGKEIRSLPDPSGGSTVLACHPRLPLLALAAPTSVVFLDLDADQTRQTIKPINVKGDSLMWHPDGELLALGAGTSVQVWDAFRGRRYWSQEHRGGGLHVVFNRPGDLLMSYGWATRTRFWNSHNGREVFGTVGGASTRFGSDNRILLYNQTGQSLKAQPMTQVTRGDEYRTLVAGIGQPQVPRDYGKVGVHPGGRLLAVRTGSGLSFLDLQTGGEALFLPSVGMEPLFERSGALITAKQSGVFRWPVDTKDPQVMRIGPPERLPLPPLSGMVQTPDGTTLAANVRDGALVWHPDRPEDAIHLQPHNKCWSVAISADGSMVATGSHNLTSLKVWNAITGELIREFLPKRILTLPFFTPDGRLGNRQGESWRVGEWTECPRGPDGVLISAAGGKLAALMTTNAVIPLIDPASGRELASLEDPNQDVMGALIFSPDGTHLIGVTGDSSCVRVWDLRRIRLGLAELDLDWEAPPFPPAANTPNENTGPLRVEVIGADDLNNRAWQLVTGPEAQRNPNQAMILAQQAVDFDPNNSVYLNTLGVVLYRVGKFNEAVEALEKSIARAPGRYDGINLYFLSMCHMKLGDPAKARDCFEKAVKWGNQQKQLSPVRVKELKESRSEAEAALSKTTEPPPPKP
jgi:serine/threonine protein kinase/WD40 repeat protein